LLQHYCRQYGFLYREVEIALPIVSESVVLEQINAGISAQTAILVIDHVASASSVVFPIHAIIELCREKDILVLVDGAHAPGMLDLTISSLKPDWYIANLHKWVCAPLGAAFVWAGEEHRATTHPLTISHWLDESLNAEFDWQGTRDISAWLASADAVKVGSRIGWNRIREHNHSMVLWMQERLLLAWGTERMTPMEGTMLGSMATVFLPDGAPSAVESCIGMRDHIYKKYRLEVPISPINGRGAVRISAQLYNSTHDIQRLIDCVAFTQTE
jgi:isopenicillin-N epimerase